jgi:hypothetical protein
MNQIDKILHELGLPPDKIDLKEARKYVKPPEKIVRPKGACGKTMFPSKSAADAGARSLLKHGKSNTSFLRSYLCPVCHAYHISSRHFSQ